MSDPSASPSDEALLRRYERAGDADAMEALVRRHAAALGAFLAGWGGDAEAEDLEDAGDDFDFNQALSGAD